MPTTERDVEALERGITRLRADIAWREGQDAIPDYDRQAIQRDRRDILAYQAGIGALRLAQRARSEQPATAAE